MKTATLPLRLNPQADMLIDHSPLTRFVTELFTTIGANDEIAAEVATHLVEANLKGHDSHGVGMVPHYVRDIGNETLNPNAHIEVRKDNGAILMVDGCAGFGQVVGRQATDLALARVKDTGIVCLGLRNAHHLGRIGGYGEQCGHAGYISIHFVNVVGHDPLVSPWGGRERRMSTNPFCCVIPRPDAPPVVLDMATSAIAQGKVRVAYMKKEPVPDGALVDAQGLPTSDPAVMFEEPLGALGPFGRHKGYGLALICELLGGGLAGEWTAPAADRPRDTIINNMLMFVVDPDAFGGIAQFDAEVSAMVEFIHSTSPAQGFDRVRVPGEPELEAKAERLREGIPIDAGSWSGIVRAAERAGMAQARIEELTGHTADPP